MAFPGVIERPLLSDELSIYFDNRRPIPLSALATFLSRIDREARATQGMDGMFLELSDFALGSNELRFRIVGPGRLSMEESARQERMAVAAETSAMTGKIAAGGAVVSAVAAVVALAIASGAANNSAYRITNTYKADTVYVRAPYEPPHVVTRTAIEYGRSQRLRAKHWLADTQREAESESLMLAMQRHEVVNLAGWVRYGARDEVMFETMNGNRFPVYLRGGPYDRLPIAIRAVVHDSPRGLQLDVVDVLAELSDF